MSETQIIFSPFHWGAAAPSLGFQLWFAPLFLHRASTPPPARPRPGGGRLLLVCLLMLGFLAHERRQPPLVHAPKFSVPLPYSTHFYFGGRRLRGEGTALNIGPPASRWSAVLPWVDTLPAASPSCLAESPPTSSNTTAPRDIAADLPGLYGAPWVASFNGNLIAALHVTVPRHTTAAPVAPVLQIYRPGAPGPAFSQTVPVSVERGSRALLYRIFAAGPANQWPIYCIDLTIPNGAGTGTAYLYYPYHGQMFEAVGSFTVKR